MELILNVKLLFGELLVFLQSATQLNMYGLVEMDASKRADTLKEVFPGKHTPTAHTRI